MAYDPKPSTWIPNWSENGTNITVPIASFTEMTAAEADADTGDIRKVLFAICEEMYQKWIATAAADRPGKMTVYRSTSVNDATDTTTKNYIFSFHVATSAQEVADEES